MISGIFILCYKSPYCQKTRITVFIDTPHFYRPAFPGCQKIRQVLPVVFINIAVFLSTGLKIRNIFYRSQVFIQTFIYVRLLTVLKKLQCSISINASVFFQCIPNIKNGIFLRLFSSSTSQRVLEFTVFVKKYTISLGIYVGFFISFYSLFFTI